MAERIDPEYKIEHVRTDIIDDKYIENLVSKKKASAKVNDPYDLAEKATEKDFYVVAGETRKPKVDKKSGYQFTITLSDGTQKKVNAYWDSWTQLGVGSVLRKWGWHFTDNDTGIYIATTAQDNSIDGVEYLGDALKRVVNKFDQKYAEQKDLYSPNVDPEILTKLNEVYTKAYKFNNGVRKVDGDSLVKRLHGIDVPTSAPVIKKSRVAQSASAEMPKADVKAVKVPADNRITVKVKKDGLGYDVGETVELEYLGEGKYAGWKDVKPVKSTDWKNPKTAENHLPVRLSEITEYADIVSNETASGTELERQVEQARKDLNIATLVDNSMGTMYPDEMKGLQKTGFAFFMPSKQFGRLIGFTNTPGGRAGSGREKTGERLSVKWPDGTNKTVGLVYDPGWESWVFYDLDNGRELLVVNGPASNDDRSAKERFIELSPSIAKDIKDAEKERKERLQDPKTVAMELADIETEERIKRLNHGEKVEPKIIQEQRDMTGGVLAMTDFVTRNYNYSAKARNDEPAYKVKVSGASDWYEANLSKKDALERLGTTVSKLTKVGSEPKKTKEPTERRQRYTLLKFDHKNYSLKPREEVTEDDLRDHKVGLRNSGYTDAVEIVEDYNGIPIFQAFSIRNENMGKNGKLPAFFAKTKNDDNFIIAKTLKDVKGLIDNHVKKYGKDSLVSMPSTSSKPKIEDVPKSSTEERKYKAIENMVGGLVDALTSKEFKELVEEKKKAAKVIMPDGSVKRSADAPKPDIEVVEPEKKDIGSNLTRYRQRLADGYDKLAQSPIALKYIPKNYVGVEDLGKFDIYDPDITKGELEKLPGAWEVNAFLKAKEVYDEYLELDEDKDVMLDIEIDLGHVNSEHELDKWEKELLAKYPDWKSFIKPESEKSSPKEVVKDMMKKADVKDLGGGVKAYSLPVLADNVKQWYKKNYPTDELGDKIDKDITFRNVLNNLEGQGDKDFYDLLGVADSVVRERVFEGLNDRNSLGYNKIYDMWLESSRKRDEKNNTNATVPTETKTPEVKTTKKTADNRKYDKVKDAAGNTYLVTDKIDPKWSEYDKTVAETQLMNQNYIVLDPVYKQPIDDEYTLYESGIKYTPKSKSAPATDALSRLTEDGLAKLAKQPIALKYIPSDYVGVENLGKFTLKAENTSKEDLEKMPGAWEVNTYKQAFDTYFEYEDLAKEGKVDLLNEMARGAVPSEDALRMWEAELTKKYPDLAKRLDWEPGTEIGAKDKKFEFGEFYVAKGGKTGPYAQRVEGLLSTMEDMDGNKIAVGLYVDEDSEQIALVDLRDGLAFKVGLLMDEVVDDGEDVIKKVRRKKYANDIAKAIAKANEEKPLNSYYKPLTKTEPSLTETAKQTASAKSVTGKRPDTARPKTTKPQTLNILGTELQKGSYYVYDKSQPGNVRVEKGYIGTLKDSKGEDYTVGVKVIGTPKKGYSYEMCDLLSGALLGFGNTLEETTRFIGKPDFDYHKETDRLDRGALSSYQDIADAYKKKPVNKLYKEDWTKLLGDREKTYADRGYASRREELDAYVPLKHKDFDKFKDNPFEPRPGYYEYRNEDGSVFRQFGDYVTVNLPSRWAGDNNRTYVLFMTTQGGRETIIDPATGRTVFTTTSNLGHKDVWQQFLNQKFEFFDERLQEYQGLADIEEGDNWKWNKIPEKERKMRAEYLADLEKVRKGKEKLPAKAFNDDGPMTSEQKDELFKKAEIAASKTDGHYDLMKMTDRQLIELYKTTIPSVKYPEKQAYDDKLRFVLNSLPYKDKLAMIAKKEWAKEFTPLGELPKKASALKLTEPKKAMISWKQGAVRYGHGDDKKMKALWVVVTKEDGKWQAKFTTETPEGRKEEAGRPYTVKDSIKISGDIPNDVKVQLGMFNVTFEDGRPKFKKIENYVAKKKREKTEKSKIKLPTQKQLSKSKM